MSTSQKHLTKCQAGCKLAEVYKADWLGRELMGVLAFLKEGRFTGLGTLSFLSVSDDPVRVCFDNHAITMDE